MRRFSVFAGMLLLFVVILSAADVTGQWKGSFDAPDQKVTLTFDLKASGDTLTGTIGGLTSPAEIKDGKIKGDTIQFWFTTEYQGNPIRLLMKGEVSGGEIKFNMGTEDGGWGTEFVAKKAE
jgi:hypothetical protein